MEGVSAHYKPALSFNAVRAVAELSASSSLLKAVIQACIWMSCDFIKCAWYSGERLMLHVQVSCF